MQHLADFLRLQPSQEKILDFALNVGRFRELRFLHCCSNWANLSLNYFVAQKTVIVSVDGKQEKMTSILFLVRVLFQDEIEYISIFMFIAHKVLVKSKLAS